MCRTGSRSGADAAGPRPGPGTGAVQAVRTVREREEDRERCETGGAAGPGAVRDRVRAVRRAGSAACWAALGRAGAAPGARGMRFSLPGAQQVCPRWLWSHGKGSGDTRQLRHSGDGAGVSRGTASAVREFHRSETFPG